MNTIHWMGTKITSNIPKEIMIKMFNLAQEDSDTYAELTKWAIPEMKKQMEENKNK